MAIVAYDKSINGKRYYFKCTYVVINLLQKLLSNPYLFGYHSAINTKPGHNLVSFQCLHVYKHLIYQRQINGRDELSLSPRTQSLNGSMPNQWARLAINVSQQTQALNQSMPNLWA